MAEIPIGELDVDQAHLALQMILRKFTDGLEQDANTLQRYGQTDTGNMLLGLRAYGVGYVDALVKAILDGRLQPKR